MKKLLDKKIDDIDKIFSDHLKKHGTADPISQDIINRIKDGRFFEQFKFNDNLFKDYGDT